MLLENGGLDVVVVGCCCLKPELQCGCRLLLFEAGSCNIVGLGCCCLRPVAVIMLKVVVV